MLLFQDFQEQVKKNSSFENMFPCKFIKVHKDTVHIMNKCDKELEFKKRKNLKQFENRRNSYKLFVFSDKNRITNNIKN